MEYSVPFLMFLLLKINLVMNQDRFHQLFGNDALSVDNEEVTIEKLEKVVAFTLQKFGCMQVSVDKSSFSTNILRTLHHIKSGRAVMVSAADKQVPFCKGFLVIVEILNNIKPLISFIPKYAEHRIVIILKNSSSKEELHQFLETQVPIFGNTDVLLVSSRNLSEGFKLGQAYKHFYKIVNMDGSWPIVSNKRYLNFMQRTIKALTYNCSIFSEIGPLDSSTGKPSYEIGAEMILFKEITERLNLTYQLKIAKQFQNKYDSGLFPRDKWYEKPLQTNNASESVDIAFCSLLNSVKKSQPFLSMSEATQLICFRFLVPRPEPIQARWNSIFKPFDSDLWFAIALALVVTTFALQRITINAELYIETKGVTKYTVIGGSLLQLVAILVLGHVPPSSSKQGPSRYLITCWALFTIIVTASFCSSLSSILTAQVYSAKLRNINDFIAHSYSWLYFDKPDFEEMFNVENQDQARWSVRGKLANNGTHYNALMKTGKYVLWGAQIKNGFLLPYEEIIDKPLLNEFEIASDCFVEYLSGFAFRVGSSFEAPFNKYIQRYRESGLITKLLNDINDRRKLKFHYVTEVFRLTKSKLAGPRRLSIEKLMGIFEVWLAGIFASIIVFLLEFCQKFKI